MPPPEPPRRRYARSAPIETPRPPWRMTPEALAAAFAGVSEGRVVRSLLLRLAREIREGREPRVRGNLRTIGYRYLLPVWSHIPDLRPENWYIRLVREARRLVTEWNLLSYVELGITDENWEGRRVGDRRPEVIVFGEDLDLVRLMRTVHARHGVTTVVFGGHSTITTEYTARDVREAMRQLDRQPPLHLLALTDHDPNGWDNAHALKRTLAHFGFEQSTLHFVVRPDLLTPEELARAAVPLRRRGAMATVLARWLRETGGIGGRAMKLEATSIPPARLLRAIEAALAVLW